MIKTHALRLSVSLIGLLSATGFAHAERLIIGHFGIPLPMMTQISSGAYDAAMGYEIEWRKFGSGTEVIAAMASPASRQQKTSSNAGSHFVGSEARAVYRA